MKPTDILTISSTQKQVYFPEAVVTDGVTNYLGRTSALTGLVGSTGGTISFWFKLNRQVDVPITKPLYFLRIGDGANYRFSVVVNAGSNFEINVIGKNSANTTIVNSGTLTFWRSNQTNNWIHFLGSWRTSGSPVQYYYANDVACPTAGPSISAGTIDYAGTGSNVVGILCDNTASAVNYADDIISIADFYFAPTFVDISQVGNRRKFITATKKPVNLKMGIDPTGTAPTILLTNSVSIGFGINKGTGGNFTVYGQAFNPPAFLVTNEKTTGGARFDGTSTSTVTYTNLATVNGTAGTFNIWFRRTNPGTQHCYFSGINDKFNIYIGTDNKFYIDGYNTVAIRVLRLVSTSTFTNPTVWNHIVASWDTNINTGIMYVNNVNETNATITPAGTISYNGNYTLGSLTTGTSITVGDASEVYFNPNTYLDLSVQATREKFIKNGLPVYLGSDGSLPTGSAPAGYLPLKGPWVWTNYGSGGAASGPGGPYPLMCTPDFYNPETVSLNGTTQYFNKSAIFTGSSNTGQGTFSCWLYYNPAALTNSTNYFILMMSDNANTTYVSIWLGVSISGKIGFFFESKVSGALVTSASVEYTTSGNNTKPGWRHLIVSWTTANAEITLNGVSTSISKSFTGNPQPDQQLLNNIYIGSGFSGATKFKGALADVWFNPSFMSFRGAGDSNIDKFINRTSRLPIYLGPTGNNPTASTPMLFLSKTSSIFHQNLGSGGDLTVNGSPGAHFSTVAGQTNDTITFA